VPAIEPEPSGGPRKSEADVGDDEADDATQKRDEVVLVEPITPEQAGDPVGDSTADEGGEHPQRRDLGVLRPRGRATHRQPDTDDRAGDSEGGRNWVASKNADGDQHGGGDEPDNGGGRGQRLADDEFGADGLGDVCAL